MTDGSSSTLPHVPYSAPDAPWLNVSEFVNLQLCFFCQALERGLNQRERRMTGTTTLGKQSVQHQVQFRAHSSFQRFLLIAICSRHRPWRYTLEKIQFDAGHGMGNPLRVGNNEKRELTDQVDNAARVSPLIIVPCNQLDEVIIKGNTS